MQLIVALISLTAISLKMVKVFVGRVPPAVTSEKLRELFEKHGSVTECNLVKDYAFVVRSFFYSMKVICKKIYLQHMDSEQAAESAIKNLHNYSIEGGVLTVEVSRRTGFSKNRCLWKSRNG